MTTATATKTMLEAALDYARMGYSVIALRPKDKRPAVPTWEPYQERAATAQELAGWWGQTPGANVGIVCGAVSGLVVLDVDNPALAGAALAAHGGLPLTPCAKTGKGRHYYFAHPGGVIRPRKLPWGDLKADGGYIVAPPSIHPSGAVYIWEVPLSAGLAPLPTWLPELDQPAPPAPTIAPPAYTPPAGGNGQGDRQRYFEAAVKGEADKVRTTPPGARNDTLNAAAFALGQLVHLGLDMDRVRSELTAAAYACGLDKDTNCGPGGIKATIESGLKDGMREPREIPPRQAPDPDRPAGEHPRREHFYQLGDRLPQQAAAAVARIAPACPDPAFRERVITTLLGRVDPKPPMLLRRAEAGQLVLDWLRAHGEFLRSSFDDLYYLDTAQRTLYRLDSLRWRAWLYTLTGVNPAGQDYAYLAADCTTVAMGAPQRPVLRVAAWDPADQVLRVSRFDGTVYRLNGVEIAEEPNGAAVLFEDSPAWAPYTPDFTAPGALTWLTDHLPNWAGDPRPYSMALRAWLVSTFFTELCPTRPLLVMLGEKGSGKTMTLRLILRLLFGSAVEVSGVPGKPDAFTAAAAAAHIMVLDNLDTFTGWLQDRLARLATGAVDEYRRLYTSNEVGRVAYRCWLAFTARTPDTLQRDDLADRLLILPVNRIAGDALQAERVFMQEVLQRRNAWWGDMLTLLNEVVLHIRAGHLAGRARLRMGDWETLGRCMAEVEDAQATVNGRPAEGAATWDRLVERLQGVQADFLLEGNPIADGLADWLETPTNRGREVTAGTLHGELTKLLFGEQRPSPDWPASPAAFGKALKSIRRELGTQFDVTWAEAGGRRVLYRIYPKGTQESF